MLKRIEIAFWEELRVSSSFYMLPVTKGEEEGKFSGFFPTMYKPAIQGLIWLH